jgi:hypothetical protein
MNSTRSSLPNKQLKNVLPPMTQDERSNFQLQLSDKDKTIESLNKSISDLQANISKSTQAHSATRHLAGQHIGALNIMLADYKGSKVDPKSTTATFDWENKEAPVV